MSLAVARRAFVAAALLLGRAAAAQTPTHSYSLDGTYADALGGPSLVGLGGSLGSTGYTFQPNRGLQLTGALNTSVYSIELVFALSTTDSYRKLVDFKNRESDMGLYNTYRFPEFYP